MSSQHFASFLHHMRSLSAATARAAKSCTPPVPIFQEHNVDVTAFHHSLRTPQGKIGLIFFFLFLFPYGEGRTVQAGGQLKSGVSLREYQAVNVHAAFAYYPPRYCHQTPGGDSAAASQRPCQRAAWAASVMRLRRVSVCVRARLCVSTGRRTFAVLQTSQRRRGRL